MRFCSILAFGAAILSVSVVAAPTPNPGTNPTKVKAQKVTVTPLGYPTANMDPETTTKYLRIGWWDQTVAASAIHNAKADPYYLMWLSKSLNNHPPSLDKTSSALALAIEKAWRADPNDYIDEPQFDAY